MTRLICGWGINDADYRVETKRRELIDGQLKIVHSESCPYYRRWIGMVQRCHSERLQRKHPTYTGVLVAEEWRNFSSFREWMMRMPWHGNELDKDILGDGRLYSKETCCFVPVEINAILTNCKPVPGKLLGANYFKHGGKWRAQSVRDGKRVSVGYFETEQEAHEAWFKDKISRLEQEIIKHNLTDRIAFALRSKVSAMLVIGATAALNGPAK